MIDGGGGWPTNVTATDMIATSFITYKKEIKIENYVNSSKNRHGKDLRLISCLLMYY